MCRTINQNTKHSQLVRHWEQVLSNCWCIREENLLQVLLWKMVHFAPFIVKNSQKLTPGFCTIIFLLYSGLLLSTKFSKLYYNVLVNKNIAYSIRVVHSTFRT
jgi:hypothetical protein